MISILGILEFNFESLRCTLLIITFIQHLILAFRIHHTTNNIAYNVTFTYFD